MTPTPANTALVCAESAKLFSVEPGAILSRNRTPAVVLARFAAMYVCHTRMGCTSTVLGELFHRDRSDISHGLRRLGLLLSAGDYAGLELSKRLGALLAAFPEPDLTTT